MAHLNRHKEQLGIGQAGEEEAIKRLMEQAGDVPEEEIGTVPEVPEEVTAVGEDIPEWMDPIIASIEEALEAMNAAIDQINENFQAIQQQLQQPQEPEEPEGEPGELEERRRELEERVMALEEERDRLKERVVALEKEKSELTKRLGEAVIDPSAAKSIDDTAWVPKDEVIQELRKIVFERIPRHWPHSVFERNTRLKALIRRLEGQH